MKNTAIKILTIALLLLGLLTCRKDPEPTMDQFELTRENLTVGATTVSVNATYDYSGKIEGIKVCVLEDGVHPEEYEAEINGKNFTVEITGLHPATAYQYYYAVDYGFSKPFTTDSKSFTTSADSPTVRTLEVMSLDSITVRVKCEVVSGGGQDVTERGICWNTYGDPTMDDETMKHTNNGTGQYTLRLEGLSYSTKYYVRAYAKNDSGIGFGEVLEFETAAEVMLPEVSTVEVGDITSTTALCVGNVASDGGGELVECGMCWSLNANPSVTGSHVAASETALGVFQVTMTGLMPNKTYHVRAYAANAKGTSYGDDLTFTTTEGLPVVTTSGITEITATTAKGGGEVTDQGASNVTERGICWGTSHNPTISGNHANNGTGAGAFTVNMTGLTPNATYYVRAYATNDQGTSYGAEVSFTAMEGLPVVQTLDVSEITSTTASGHGKVTDQGGSAVSERGICWSTEPSPSTSGNHSSSGTGTGEYTVNLTNLTPGTKYYVRAYATNAQGTTYGEQKDFTTAANLPTVLTGSINGTTVSGEVTNSGGATVTERGICWSTSHNPTTSGAHGSSGTGTGTFSVELTDFAPGTTYYVRAYATNSAGTAYGSEKTLTTEANLPTVTTGDVYNIAQTTALGSGNVTNDGGATVTERGICWSTSHNPTISGNHASNGTGTGSFTVNMTGLTSNTHYYVRAYAKNSAGVSYGNEVDFTTALDISAPTVITSQVTSITQTTATGGGNVTATGGATVTERGICWSTSHNPTTAGSHASSGTGMGSFSVNMTGLTANTTYYVRAYAINSAGTSYGSEVSFTTQQTQSYTVNVSANPSTGGAVNGGGTYQQNQSCTVTAAPATGYSFVNWTEGGNPISTNASYTFTVTGNRTLVANFNQQPIWPNGILPGAFSVSGDQQVHFSQGNLQYMGSAAIPYWKFADNQWDYLGTTTGQNSSDENVDRDLFGWGTSGYHDPNDPYNWNYQPWSTSTLIVNQSYNYNGYGPSTNMPSPNLNGSSASYDWGVYNSISNGGNASDTWRTLTREEWNYVFNMRSTSSGIRYAKAQVNNVNGVILLPDNWSANYYMLSNTNISYASFSSNTITSSQWSTLEQYGAVFLPAAGERRGTGFNGEGSKGSYWSVSYNSNKIAFGPLFYDSYLDPPALSDRYDGRSVRLVQDY